jgi:hypothetical protein
VPWENLLWDNPDAGAHFEGSDFAKNRFEQTVLHVFFPFYMKISSSYTKVYPFYTVFLVFYTKICPFYTGFLAFYTKVYPFYTVFLPFYTRFYPFYKKIDRPLRGFHEKTLLLP